MQGPDKTTAIQPEWLTSRKAIRGGAGLLLHPIKRRRRLAGARGWERMLDQDLPIITRELQRLFGVNKAIGTS